MSYSKDKESIPTEHDFRFLRDTEKVDKRRDKKYGRKARLVTYRVPMINSLCVPNGYQFLNPRLMFQEQLIHQLGLAEGVKLEVSDFQSEWVICIRTFVRADKPSLIVEDEVALALLPTDKLFEKCIRTAHADTLRQRDEIDDKYIHLKQTQRLLNWFLEKTQKKAKANMRFEQRLKALSAEYKAEIDTIADSELGEAMQYLNDNKDDEKLKDFEQEDFDLFEEHAAEFVRKDNDSGLPTMFPRRGNADDPMWIRKKVGFLLGEND